MAQSSLIQPIGASHDLIHDLQGLPAVVDRRQSSPSSPQKVWICFEAINSAADSSPAHISFDGLAVTTHCSCPEAPGVPIKGVTTFLKPGVPSDQAAVPISEDRATRFGEEPLENHYLAA
jgi:hypothetical protein